MVLLGVPSHELYRKHIACKSIGIRGDLAVSLSDYSYLRFFTNEAAYPYLSIFIYIRSWQYKK